MKIQCIIDPITESNSYIVIDEKLKTALMIDANSYSDIKKIILDEGLKLEKVILTHEHYDHISGLNELRENFPIEVIASNACSEGIQDDKTNKSKTFGVYLHFIGKHQYKDKMGSYTCEKADVVFQNRLEISWNTHRLELYETPGHSAGGITIILDNKYLFTGDTLLFIKDTIINSRGGNTKDFEEITMPFLKSLDKNLEVFPGHGQAFPLKMRIC